MVKSACFADNAMGGTLARDHQSRAMTHVGRHRRTYVAYMDHDFDARVLAYDHDGSRWSDAVRIGTTQVEGHPPDGHNVPNLFVSRDGTIHLFYGSHGTPFRYARSKSPEEIDRWELGETIGERTTYPFVVERTNGELLLFYRHGGAQIDSPLVFQRSRDLGGTWEDRVEVVRFGAPSSVKIHNVLYDASHDRIHFSLHDRTNVPVPALPSAFPAYYCAYDPAEGRVFGMNGDDLGPVADRRALIESHSRMAPFELVDPEDNATGWMDLCLHQGKPLFVFNDQQDRLYFGWWDGKEVVRHELSPGTHHGVLARSLAPTTTDGRNLRMYGIALTDPPTDCNGGDLFVWTSEDGGRTWDDGACLIDRRGLGHGLDTLNLVMNYGGSGPFMLVPEPTGRWPEGLERTPQNHYDNPSRRNRRLYAADTEGCLFPRAG
ncbi:MAG: BNR-4 repeat-containing protein [Candidatus Latescibacteria bacterium]|jgi:hypothetical protein|nr:BNR-4 repeat-containing protein [Candidatus Latescibacterota bacterium]